jgi:hypothetical protein
MDVVYSSHYHKNSPVPNWERSVLNQTRVLFFYPVDMHTPFLKIKEDIEFPKVITAKQLPGKA